MKNLKIVVVTLFALVSNSYAIAASAKSSCGVLLSHFLVDQRPAKISEGLQSALRHSRRNFVTAYLVIDSFLPVENRGQKPAILAIKERIQSTGANIDESYGKPDEIIPKNGLRTLKVSGSSDSIWQASSLSQVIWLAKAVSPKTLNRLSRERDLDPKAAAQRYKLEKKLTENRLSKLEKERRQTQLESKTDEANDIRGQIAEISSETKKVEFNLSMTSAQSNDGAYRFWRQQELYDLERAQEKLYETLDVLEQEIQELKD